MTTENIRVLDRTDSNMLVQHTNGEVENISMSPLNRLLFDHGLWGLLREGNEILHIDGKSRGVTVIPSEDARQYTMKVGETEPLHVGEHQKSALVDALMECYNESEGRDPTPLLELYDRLRADMVRKRVVNHIGASPVFKKQVQRREDGWLINGHLLLTWDNEFIHPGTTSRKVRGSVVQAGASEQAYQMRFSQPGSGSRTLTIEGKTYRLTDGEMEFIARAMWGMEQSPKN